MGNSFAFVDGLGTAIAFRHAADAASPRAALEVQVEDAMEGLPGTATLCQAGCGPKERRT